MKEAQPLLDVNAATREELLERGIIPALADRILQRRGERGPFRDENDLYDVVRDNEIRMDQLLGIVHVPGAGDKQGYST